MASYIKAVASRLVGIFQRKKYHALRSFNHTIRAAVSAYKSTELRDKMIHELVKSYEVLVDEHNDAKLAVQDLHKQVLRLKQEARVLHGRISAIESNIIE